MTELSIRDNYQAGESLVQEVTVNEDGSPKDIRNAAVEWYLLSSQGDDESAALLSTADAGVSTTLVDAQNGRLNVRIDQGVTDGFGGRRLWQRLVVDDNVEGKQIFSGEFIVERP